MLRVAIHSQLVLLVQLGGEYRKKVSTYVFRHIGSPTEIRPFLIPLPRVVIAHRVLVPDRMEECQQQAISHLNDVSRRHVLDQVCHPMSKTRAHPIEDKIQYQIFFIFDKCLGVGRVLYLVPRPT